MRKIYHLGTCDTNRRIIKELDLKNKNFELQDIKKDAISEEQLEEMKDKIGSYEKLFSKRARNYKKLELKDKNLTENDLKKLILSDYTFLLRPVVIFDDEIFSGNAKNTVNEIFNKLNT